MVGITIKGELCIGVGAIIWIIFRGIVSICRKKFEFKRECLFFVALVYILWVIGMTLFPLEITWNEEFQQPSVVNVNWNLLKPFEDIRIVGIGITLKNIIGNLVLFVPLGIFFSMVLKNVKYYHMLLIGILSSLAIELGQLLEMYFGMAYARVTDINDVILNTCGVLIGKFIYDHFLKEVLEKKYFTPKTKNEHQVSNTERL